MEPNALIQSEDAMLRFNFVQKFLSMCWFLQTRWCILCWWRVNDLKSLDSWSRFSDKKVKTIGSMLPSTRTSIVCTCRQTEGVVENVPSPNQTSDCCRNARAGNVANTKSDCCHLYLNHENESALQNLLVEAASNWVSLIFFCGWYHVGLVFWRVVSTNICLVVYLGTATAALWGRSDCVCWIEWRGRSSICCFLSFAVKFACF